MNAELSAISTATAIRMPMAVPVHCKPASGCIRGTPSITQVWVAITKPPHTATSHAAGPPNKEKNPTATSMNRTG
jgi:hypothetical protein